MTARRALLAGLAAMAAAGHARAQTADSASLLIPGPEAGVFAAFATRAAAGLARHMPHAVALRVEAIGGPDGVTVANRFATADAPDGRSLLLLTGAAAHARLTGETRVRFDPSAWVPIVALAQPVWLVGRGGRPDPGGAGPVRVAIGAPDQADAVAVFALDLLSVRLQAVVGHGPEAAEAAFQAGRVDALLLQGANLASRAAALGAEPWLRFDPVADNAPPAFTDLAAGAPASLNAAGMAAAAALRTRAIVLLPALTPADHAAAWRRAGGRFAEDEARDAAVSGARMLGPIEAAALLATLCPGPEAVTVWRDWAHRRLGVRAT